jgi:hypothetical protein
MGSVDPPFRFQKKIRQKRAKGRQGLLKQKPTFDLLSKNKAMIQGLEKTPPPKSSLSLPASVF